MKKIFLASLVILFLGIYSQAQNNIIVQQSKPATSGPTTDSNTYYINGISAKEDIGGVEYIIRYDSDYDKTVLDLTNYHNFTVTVLIDFEWSCSNRNFQMMSDGVKSFVLRANETKSFDVGRDDPWCECANILGMIVRKLQ